MNAMNTLPTITGLCVALAGPALLVSPAAKILGNPAILTTKLLEQAVLWVLFGLTIAIILLWERLPLSSIGLKPLSWQSFAWGLAVAGMLIVFVCPALIWALKKAGIPGFESGLAKLTPLPIWLLVLAVGTAGIIEETLFRGYAIERLSSLTEIYWLGGLIALTIFVLVHLPSWGLGPMLTHFCPVKR
jgi:membrane protease YdiL (CAAX protease family)